MVASAKLRKVQNVTLTLKNYKESLFDILDNLLSEDRDIVVPMALPHEEKRHVSIVAFASNTSLCGSFNNNVTKLLKTTVEEYLAQGVKITVYPVGEKIYKAAVKLGYEVVADYRHYAAEASYSQIADFARQMMERYVAGETDEVCMVYTRFYSAGRQVPETARFLPMELSSIVSSNGNGEYRDYILEPSAEGIIEHLLPYAMCTKFYDVFLSATASEHAARMVAMQTASDNASDLVDELRLTYNKQRQQAITEELTDISNSN